MGILWQVKIGDNVWGDFVDTAIALAMAVKKAGLSQELHPKDVRKSSQGKQACSIATHKMVPTSLQGTQWLQNPHQPELSSPHVVSSVWTMLGCFCNMHSLIPFTHSNVLVDALICVSTIPDEDRKQCIAGPGSKTMFHSGLEVHAH
jgi:hypothetical protein